MEVTLTSGLEILLMAVLAVAAYTDLRWLMVPNWAIMPALGPLIGGGPLPSPLARPAAHGSGAGRAGFLPAWEWET